MSSKGRMSAYAVFKGKKTASLSNVSDKTPKSLKKKKSSSANTTPTDNAVKHGKISSFLNKLTQSEKKKARKDLLKPKKLATDGDHAVGRLPLLREPALKSPFVPNSELKSLRPKPSTPIRNYSLPLKATPEVNGNLQYKETSTHTTNGLSATEAAHAQRSQTHRSPKGSKKRSCSKSGMQSPGSERPIRSQTASRVPTSASPGSAAETVPPKPAKRRRLSNAPPSPQQSIQSTASSQRTEPMPAHPSERRSQHPFMFDSQQEAKTLFECLIHPVKSDHFFKNLFERKPLVVKRHMANFNDGWFSTSELDRILREETLNFSENVDVVEYINGKRMTYNPPGRAYAPVVWDYYSNGCSVRVLNPHTYSDNVWKMLSMLQEHFGCMVGANIYLTPPGTQGFAPHYDDIEAFILQLEGKKHWKLYNPRTSKEALPKYSSGNFSDTDIGEPIVDVILEPGDLLYFPRGTIHQGKTLEDAHSLHITISCMQRNSWSDLLETLLPRALEIAFEEDIEYRKSLPTDYMNYMGVSVADGANNSSQRQQFLNKVSELVGKLVLYTPVDAAADQMAKKYIHDSLPPFLSGSEKQCSIRGASNERWDPVTAGVVAGVELEPDDDVKLIRKGCIRIVCEDEEKVRIYHNLENARLYHKVDAQYIELTPELANGVEYLLNKYPEYVKVDDLPLESVEDKVELASALYDKGLLLMKTPPELMSDAESDQPETLNKMPPKSRDQPMRSHVQTSAV